MTIKTDEAAIFEQVVRNPKDDIVRLVYADCIQECGQTARAEFIRLQVSLSAGGVGDELRREMNERVAELWYQLGVSEQFSGGGISSWDYYYGEEGIYLPHLSGTVSRGFPETLYFPTLVDLCEWEGDDYTGKPTALALDAIRAHPTITRVIVGDRQPSHLSRRWLWHNADHPLSVQGGQRDLLPQPIHELLKGYKKRGRNKSVLRLVKSYSTEQAALDALAVAAGQWLRSHTRWESQ